GMNGGQADPAAAGEDPDGVFFVNSKIAFRDMTDGSSNTLLFSEHTLGDGSPAPTTGPVDPTRIYVDARNTVAAGEPLTDAACASADVFLTNRGSAWADGNYVNGLFNTYYAPNDARPDCIRHSNPGFKAARSRHTGGVNVAMGDGSVRFIGESIDLWTWRALGSRNGGEVVTEF